MNFEPGILYNLPKILATSLGPVFWLLLILLAAFLYLKRVGPETSTQGFDADLPLQKIVRTALCLVLSRWWILGILIIIGIDRISTNNIVCVLTYKGANPFLQNTKFVEPLNEIFSVNTFQEAVNYFLKDLEEAVSNIESIWKLKPEVLVRALAAWPLLYWFRKAFITSDYSLESKTDRFKWSYVNLVLFVSPLTATFIIFVLFPDINISDFMAYSFMLGHAFIADGLLSPIIFTLWFSVLMMVGYDWHLRNRNKEINATKESFVLRLYFKMFFVIFFVTAARFGIIMIDNFMQYYYNYYPQEISESKILYSLSGPYGIPFISKMILMFFSWMLFPLPFLVAFNDHGIKKGVVLGAKIYRLHFRKVVTLVAVIVAIMTLSSLPNDLYRSVIHVPFFIASSRCDLPWYDSIFQMMFEIIKSFALTFSFMIAVVAFQSGAFDLPEDMGDEERGKDEEQEEGAEEADNEEDDDEEAVPEGIEDDQ